MLIVLWVRSYWWVDAVEVSSWHEVGSSCGEIFIDDYDTTIALAEPWSHLSFETSSIPGGGRIADTTLGFKLSKPPAGRYAAFPHWFAILLFATLAAAPWIRQRNWRFSSSALC